MEKVKVQVAGLAQLCFEHADIRNHFFQHVLMKNVRKVQEERSRSPDCSHCGGCGLPGEEHQVSGHQAIRIMMSGMSFSGTMRRTSESGSGTLDK